MNCKQAASQSHLYPPQQPAEIHGHVDNWEGLYLRAVDPLAQQPLFLLFVLTAEHKTLLFESQHRLFCRTRRALMKEPWPFFVYSIFS